MTAAFCLLVLMWIVAYISYWFGQESQRFSEENINRMIDGDE